MIDESLSHNELVLTGGHWGGLLLDNPRTGLPLSLTWGFTFDFEPVVRDFGKSRPGLTVDRVPLAGRSWTQMAGAAVNGLVFGNPMEASVYFFEHHRFDEASVRITDQHGPDVRTAVGLRGDVDGLGLDFVAVDAWLAFSGIIVASSHEPRTAKQARRLLERFMDTTGLISADRQRGFRFIPEKTEG